jgi:predicted nucleic acid-binding protein
MPETAEAFFDTNVLIYAYDRSAGRKHDIAAGLLRSSWESGTGCLSIQVLQEFYVTVTRKIPSPLKASATADVVADLAHWRVHSPDGWDVLQAIRLEQQHPISFWDAMVVQSAIRLGCRQLLSENLSRGQRFGATVTVVNPFTDS